MERVKLGLAPNAKFPVAVAGDGATPKPKPEAACAAAAASAPVVGVGAAAAAAAAAAAVAAPVRVRSASRGAVQVRKDRMIVSSAHVCRLRSGAAELLSTAACKAHWMCLL